MTENPLTTLRRICLSFPEAREVEAWGAPTFRVKTMFASYSDGSFTKDDRPSVWIKAEPVNQQLLVRRDPDRFFVPPYLGVKGWVAVRLDQPVPNWAEIRDLLWDAWGMSVTKTLLKKHPEPPGEG
jgi:hypothetical protein